MDGLKSKSLKRHGGAQKYHSYLKQKNSANPNMPMGGMPGALFACTF
jgi:hypothetical protein